MHTRWQGCYDDAMNAADEHGVIHPEACCHPITGNKKGSIPEGSNNSSNSGEKKRAPENDRSVPKPTTTHQPPLATAVEKETPVANGDAVVEQLVAAGAMSSAMAGEAIRPFFLSVLQDMCELARPEIAASFIVAGACKVRKTKASVRMGGLGRCLNALVVDCGIPGRS